jgi:hypothetical protein
MARRTDIIGSLRAVSCSQPDQADPLRSEKSAELAIALNPTRPTRCAGDKRRACDRPQPDQADPLRSEKRRACDRP